MRILSGRPKRNKKCDNLLNFVLFGSVILQHFLSTENKIYFIILVFVAPVTAMQDSPTVATPLTMSVVQYVTSLKSDDGAEMFEEPQVA